MYPKGIKLRKYKYFSRLINPKCARKRNKVGQTIFIKKFKNVSKNLFVFEFFIKKLIKLIYFQSCT
jgi:hypothetical protein